jgi:ribose transport system ATP-binding protein
MIFGADKKDSGTIYLDGEIFDPRSPRDSVRSGVGLIPEDRKQQGVVVGLPIQWNITLSILKRISKASVINRDKENAVINELIKSLKIKTPTAKQLVKNLSGGNQQKVVLAKWLAVNCKVLIFDEPTRGIDVDAKQEIYKLMNNLCAQGIGIIMISSDMEEIIGMSDRILVLCEGQQTGLLNRNEFTQEAILSYASGNN